MIGTRPSARRAMWLPAGLAIGALLGIAGLSGGGVAAVGQTPLGQASWVNQINSKVRLVSGTVPRDGNTALYAGIELRMDPGWKTYWRNPGDSGVPPSFDWSGSKNLKSAEVLYPAPHRFDDAGGTAIGYDSDVIFPVRIEPERAGEPVELKLAFDYGLCRDLCIPNAVELDAVLPPDLGKGDASLLDTALARVPKLQQADALPRIANITAHFDGPKPHLEVEAMFPERATGTDLFVNSPEVLVPVPKALGPLANGKQRFAVTFLLPSEVDAIKGKPLSFTLVSDQGSIETTWTAE